MERPRTTTGAPQLRISRLTPETLDRQGLEQRLKETVKGEVRFDGETRALYASDASNYRQVPIGVVLPRDADDIVATMAACRAFGAPVLPRGGGTSLGGQTVNVAVVIDTSKYYNRVLAVDPTARRARVQTGTILDVLRTAAGAHGLTYGPDPATHNHCTLGGMIGNDSCGMHAQMAGRTSQNVHALEVLTYDGARFWVKDHYSDDEIAEIVRVGGRKGEIFQRLVSLRDRYADRIRARFPHIPRLVSGYGLQFLLPEHGFNVAGALVGSEATCVFVLEAVTRLVENPPKRALVILGYPDVYHAGDHVKDVLPFQPVALEGIDQMLVDLTRHKHLNVEDLALLPEGHGWLIVELGDWHDETLRGRAEALMAALRQAKDPPSMRLLTDPTAQRRLWEIREAALGVTTLVPGRREYWPGWEDSAVPPDVIGAYMRDLHALFEKYGYLPSVYGHFGQGCVHCSIDFDLSSEPGIRDFRAFVQEAAETVVRYGGSLSGEHGDGQARGELLGLMFGDDLVHAFEEFKALWDPLGKMNPGKVVNANPITSDLRLGADFHPEEPPTHFKFPADNGSFLQATLRCVGVGQCRRLEGGTMCPSFMVTREERHTTRGRAHALFEMLKGTVLTHGWKDDGVKETLDLCLSCKGCKSDCPVSVDMATYKAEFLSHYYEGRLRGPAAYSMGLIYWWSRLAALAPHVANALTHTPGLEAIAKRVAGLAPRRTIPSFAPETFKAWWKRRSPANVGARQVVLWVDTFNNHFHPHVARSAVEVLEATGFQVIVPEESLCCGRPLYDFGFLDQAEGLLKRDLVALRPYLEEGLSVVGLEPSCVAVFRDELTNLFPDDPDAHRLRDRALTLAELLVREASDFPWPRLERRALVHGHCHHKAVMKLDADETLLRRLGLDFRVLDSGCCGMAGSFGFERDKADLSIAIGERVLLPAVREAPEDTLILTDGFSCHEQIRQESGKQAMHLAEVLRMALGDRIEPEAVSPAKGPTALEGVLVGLGVLAVAGGAWWALARRQGGR